MSTPKEMKVIFTYDDGSEKRSEICSEPDAQRR